ncbi:hypothetical protein [Amycolatopsis sp. NPDC003731]
MASPSQRPGHLDSERGFLEVAGRDPDRPLRDQFLGFRDLVSADMAWVDSRKSQFRRRAAIVRVSALLLTAASTVVLGIQEIPASASTASATSWTTTSSRPPRPS